MKKSIIVLNVILAIILMALAIIQFVVGNIIIGIVDLIGFGIIVFALLDHVAFLWDYSPEVSRKYIFTCPKCGHQSIPTFWTWFLVPHIGSRRYMKCEKCHKLSWMRRK